ncbi:MAG: tetratricopeptide repeat protein [Erythrobacter sp.]
MRFAPAAAALSLVLVTTASVTIAGNYTPDPRAAALQREGRAALSKGDTEAAIDAFEAALAVDPAHTALFVDLGEASRQVGLQGKAITYYREALAREPRNFAAMSGEGEALAERGALEKAKRSLAQLESLCGATCPETVALRSLLSSGAKPRFAAETPGDSTPASN